MRKLSIYLILIFGQYAVSSAQVSGNVVFESNSLHNPTRFPAPSRSLYQIDGRNVNMSLTIQYHAKVLEYVVTFGVSEEAKDVITCTEKIDQRIADFISDLKKLGIARDQTFVDAITHNRIYSYEILEQPKVAKEEMVGFVVKKNVMVRYKDSELLSKIAATAAKQEIYDMIKVDYSVEDRISVLSQLMPHIDKLVKERQDLLKITGEKTVFKDYEIKGHNISTIHPLSQYKQYTAQSTNTISVSNYYYQNLPRISARKESTYYYQPTDPSQFDLVLYGNENRLMPTVIYEITVQVSFNAI